jgi:hypothetical protein
MAQGTAADVGVEKGRHGAQLGERKPGLQEGRPVLHAQRHHVAALHAQGAQGVGRLVDALVHIGVAERLRPIDQERPGAMLRHDGFKTLGQTLDL